MPHNRGMTRIRIVVLALLIAAAARAQTEVFAIRYATLPDFPLAGLVQGEEKSHKIDIAMMVWLVRGNGHNILVDTGFYRPEYFKQWKVLDFLRPDEAVARAGVKADDVTDVIITHFHWDHANGADLFPKAQVWIQKEEYEHYTKDLAVLDRAKSEGRLHLVEGDREILPGIRVMTGGKHTFASQYVVVDAKPGPIVLASDNVYLYENLEKHLPIAQTVDAASNLAAQGRMKALVRDGGVIVPGHDPEVMKRFPKVNDRVVRIVAPADDFHVSVIWVHADKASSASVYGSGAAIRDDERAFRTTRENVEAIEKLLRDAHFLEMPSMIGTSETDYLNMRGKIEARIGGTEHSVVQVVGGPQSEELATLAAAILAKALPGSGAVTAESLDDGLRRIAAGEIPAEALQMSVQRFDERGGFSLVFEGDEATVRPYGKTTGVGDPHRLRLSEAEVRKLAETLREVPKLPLYLNAPAYTDFRADVLNRSKEVQGRPEYQLSRKELEALVEVVRAIAERALK